MNPIFAKRLKIIYNNGTTKDYTHVTHLYIESKNLYIGGEINDSFDLRRVVYDKIPTKHINVMIVEFYEPKE